MDIFPADVHFELSTQYAEHLKRYLVDAYALLVMGNIHHEALRVSAETANLYKQGRLRTTVITNDVIQEYQSAIQAIINTASSYYLEKLDTFEKLLCSTTAGRQGVPAANIELNFWRYMRKLTAKELYRCGFFTDSIPQEGTLTIFYDNEVELIKQFFI